MWKKHADSDIQRRGRALPFDLYFIHKLCSQVIPIKLYYSCWLCVIYVITYIALLVCFVVGRRLLSYHVLGSISVLSQNTVT